MAHNQRKSLTGYAMNARPVITSTSLLWTFRITRGVAYFLFGMLPAGFMWMMSCIFVAAGIPDLFHDSARQDIDWIIYSLLAGPGFIGLTLATFLSPFSSSLRLIVAVVALLVCGSVAALRVIGDKYHDIAGIHHTIDLINFMLGLPQLSLPLMAAAAWFIEAFLAITFRLLRSAVFRARNQ